MIYLVAKILLGVSMVTVLSPSAIGQRPQAMYRDVTVMPPGVTGERVQAILDAINSNDSIWYLPASANSGLGKQQIAVCGESHVH